MLYPSETTGLRIRGTSSILQYRLHEHIIHFSLPFPRFSSVLTVFPFFFSTIGTDLSTTSGHADSSSRAVCCLRRWQCPRWSTHGRRLVQAFLHQGDHFWCRSQPPRSSLCPCWCSLALCPRQHPDLWNARTRFINVVSRSACANSGSTLASLTTGKLGGQVCIFLHTLA